MDADGITINVITGGFPCQDISFARTGSGQGLGLALAGSRSGLWFEYLRLIGELEPEWVIIENVSALRTRGLDVILHGLRSEEHTSELQSLMRISYAVFCLNKKIINKLFMIYSQSKKYPTTSCAILTAFVSHYQTVTATHP